MEEGDRKTPISVPYAIMAALIGSAITAAIMLVGMTLVGNEASGGDIILEINEMSASIENLRQEQQNTREELNAVRVELSDMRTEISPMAGDTAAEKTEVTVLPPPYIEQVGKFFESSAARNLLTPDLQNDRRVKFGAPSFVSTYLISVPYSAGGSDHYMLVEITVLDLYNLQFDVVWDSLEGKRK